MSTGWWQWQWNFIHLDLCNLSSDSSWCLGTEATRTNFRWPRDLGGVGKLSWDHVGGHLSQLAVATGGPFVVAWPRESLSCFMIVSTHVLQSIWEFPEIMECRHFLSASLPWPQSLAHTLAGLVLAFVCKHSVCLWERERDRVVFEAGTCLIVCSVQSQMCRNVVSIHFDTFPSFLPNSYLISIHRSNKKDANRNCKRHANAPRRLPASYWLSVSSAIFSTMHFLMTTTVLVYWHFRQNFMLFERLCYWEQLHY